MALPFLSKAQMCRRVLGYFRICWGWGARLRVLPTLQLIQQRAIGYVLSLLSQVMGIGQSLGEPPSLTAFVLGRHPSQVPLPSPAITLRETLPLPAAAHCRC